MVVYNLWNQRVNLDIEKESFPVHNVEEKDEKLMPGCKHGWFRSSRNGELLHYRKVLPRKARPKAVIVIQHGIIRRTTVKGGESSNKKSRNHHDSSGTANFAHLIDFLVEKYGYAVYALDALGHGYSEGKRNIIPDYKINVKDLDRFARFVGCQHDFTPLFLMGDSYGATLAIQVVVEWQENHPPSTFCGTILLEPLVLLNNNDESTLSTFTLSTFKSLVFLCCRLWESIPISAAILSVVVGEAKNNNDYSKKKLLDATTFGTNNNNVGDGFLSLETLTQVIASASNAQEQIKLLYTPFSCICGTHYDSSSTDYITHNAPSKEQFIHQIKQGFLLDSEAAKEVAALAERFMSNKIQKSTE